MAVLLNWVVQGLIVAAAAAAGLRVLASASARVRHAFVLSAYGLVLALPVLPVASTRAALVPRALGAPGLTLPLATVPAVWWTAPHLVALLCLAWSVFHGVRLAMSAAALRRAKRRSGPCPQSLLDGLPHWARVSATGRPVDLVVSERVRFAAVLGCGRPVIALAPRLVDGLAAADLDRVLVHEWAHVQRRDDVVQVVRWIARALVGWHPAVWWLERRVKEECEAACDEIAVSVTGSARDYAAALVTLAGLPRGPIRPMPVLGAVPVSGARHRVARILASDGPRRPRQAMALCAGAVLIMLSVTVSHVRAVTMEAVQGTLPAAVRPMTAEAAVTSTVPATMSAILGTGTNDWNPRATAPAGLSTPVRTRHASRTADEMAGSSLAPLLAETAVPTSLTWPTMTPLSPLPAAAVVSAAVMVDSRSPTADAPKTAESGILTPWAAAATAGVAVGRASQGVGVATAGFFARLGKHIAHSF